MKHIKRLRLFENSQELTQDQIDFLDEFTNGEWIINPETGLVDINGGFVCRSKKGLDSFKGIKFGIVTKGFDCSYNSLTSLEGSPKKVGQGFFCSHNSLTSLKGSPHEVGGSFDCDHNKLTTLEGAPQEVGWSFDCSNNYLRSLEGAPQKVEIYFDCSNNYLKSLEGSPSQVVGSFNCSRNPLRSLNGLPQEVGGYLDCSHNLALTSLEGAPHKLDGYFKCDLLVLTEENWNPQGWLEILREGKGEAKKLIATLPQFPEELSKEIKKDPSKWSYELKDIWNKDYFRPIRDKLDVPKDFIEDAGLYGDLTSIGLDI